jgi:hypothetical protein
VFCALVRLCIVYIIKINREINIAEELNVHLTGLNHTVRLNLHAVVSKLERVFGLTIIFNFVVDYFISCHGSTSRGLHVMTLLRC